MPKQDLPLVPYQKALGWLKIVHVLPSELGYHQIFVHLLQVGGYFVRALGRS